MIVVEYPDKKARQGEEVYLLRTVSEYSPPVRARQGRNTGTSHISSTVKSTEKQSLLTVFSDSPLYPCVIQDPKLGNGTAYGGLVLSIPINSQDNPPKTGP